EPVVDPATFDVDEVGRRPACTTSVPRRLASTPKWQAATHPGEPYPQPPHPRATTGAPGSPRPAPALQPTEHLEGDDELEQRSVPTVGDRPARHAQDGRHLGARAVE